MNTPVPSPNQAGPSHPPDSIRYEFPAQKPTVTYIILVTTIFSFILQQLSLVIYDVDIVSILLAKSNDLIYAGQVWRLFTPAFVHADIIHIGFNMYALYIIGRRLERVYGHQRFLMLYFLSAFAGNLVSFYLTPNPSVGASTAIFGLLAAEGVYIYNNRRFFPQAQRVLTNLVMILVFNIFYGFSIPNIDIWGHLGGFLGGLGYAWFAGPMIGIQRKEMELHLVDVHIGQRAMKVGIIEAMVLVVLSIFRIVVGG